MSLTDEEGHDNSGEDELQRKKMPLSFVLVVFFLLLPVLYVLSAAPMLALCHSTEAHSRWDTIYGPVVLSYAISPASIQTALFHWFELWELGPILEVMTLEADNSRMLKYQP